MHSVYSMTIPLKLFTTDSKSHNLIPCTINFVYLAERMVLMDLNACQRGSSCDVNQSLCVTKSHMTDAQCTCTTLLCHIVQGWHSCESTSVQTWTHRCNSGSIPGLSFLPPSELFLSYMCTHVTSVFHFQQKPTIDLIFFESKLFDLICNLPSY